MGGNCHMPSSAARSVSSLHKRENGGGKPEEVKITIRHNEVKSICVCCTGDS